MKQAICMKWGTLYGPEYVNRLYSMVRRNTTGDLHFVCLTDDPTGVGEEVRCLPCPTVPMKHPWCNTGWRKLALWQPQLYDLRGTFLFMDLDVVIVDSIDELFTWGDGFCVMRNWTQPKKKIGNTSVFRYEIGSHPEIWEGVLAQRDELVPQHINEQTYISNVVSRMSFFPEPWCALFKVHCVPRSVPMRWLREPCYPEGTKVVAFPGNPNPPDAAAGIWPAKWYKKFYKHIRPARWVSEHWR
jgi:hypothetical protein